MNQQQENEIIDLIKQKEYVRAGEKLIPHSKVDIIFTLLFHIAVCSKNLQIVKALFDQDDLENVNEVEEEYNFDIIMTAIYCRNEDIFRFIVEHPKTVIDKDRMLRTERSYLYIGFNGPNSNIMQYILDRLCVKVETFDDIKSTLYYYATNFRYFIQHFKLLYSHDHFRTEIDYIFNHISFCSRLLVHCMLFNRNDVFDFVIEKYPIKDINQRLVYDENTLLHIACFYKNMYCVERLLNMGADYMTIKNRNGLVAYDIPKFNNRFNISIDSGISNDILDLFDQVESNKTIQSSTLEDLCYRQAKRQRIPGLEKIHNYILEPLLNKFPE